MSMWCSAHIAPGLYTAVVKALANKVQRINLRPVMVCVERFHGICFVLRNSTTHSEWAGMGAGYIIRSRPAVRLFYAFSRCEIPDAKSAESKQPRFFKFIYGRGIALIRMGGLSHQPSILTGMSFQRQCPSPFRSRPLLLPDAP